MELNCHDLNALVARSRCYLCLGEPSKALTDAETALSVEKSNIRALFQKAESLYYLGELVSKVHVTLVNITIKSMIDNNFEHSYFTELYIFLL